MKRSLALLAGYFGLAIAMTWPLGLHLGTALPGWPNIDAFDTTLLRGVVGELLTHPWDMPHTSLVYWPSGYPIMWLVPNAMDHLSGSLLGVLPFPWSDNLWWLLTLTAASRS